MADRTIGVLLPIKRGKTGYFDASIDVVTQIKSNLVNLVMTRKGERVFQPEFGTDLHELIFEQMDDEFPGRVEAAIRAAVARWMPFLIIDEIQISLDPDRNRTLVQITFSLRSNINVTDTVVVEF